MYKLEYIPGDLVYDEYFVYKAIDNDRVGLTSIKSIYDLQNLLVGLNSEIEV